jgi:DNA replication protein DnaC
MNEPKPASEAAREVIERLATQIQSRENDADFRRRVEEYEAYIAGRRKRGYEKLCIERGVPLAKSLMEIAIQQNPPTTMAINGIRDALTWRQSKTGYGGSRYPLILVLSSPPGAGKTTAMAWATGQHKYSALYVYARVITATPDNGWSENQDKWDRWTGVDLLSIDEIGIDSGGVGADLLGALLSRRYDFGRATICATNCDWETFKVRYVDERLMSRLEYGYNPWVDLSDCDLRNPVNKAEIVEGV